MLYQLKYINKTIARGRRPSAGCSAAWRRLLDAWLEEVATMILRKLTILMASKRHFNSWTSMVINGYKWKLSLSLSIAVRSPELCWGQYGIVMGVDGVSWGVSWELLGFWWGLMGFNRTFVGLCEILLRMGCCNDLLIKHVTLMGNHVRLAVTTSILGS